MSKRNLARRPNGGAVARAPSLRANLFRGVALTVFSWATHAYALPTGGTITGTSGGGVTITTSGTTTTVTSSAHRALIDWTSFAVASGETVTFNEPDKDAIVVNRQLFGSASYINGYIESLVGGVVGGNVWIINPNGVIFGPSAHLNVGGLLATTSNLVSDSTFLSGADTDPVAFSFSGNGTPSIRIEHGANITVHDGSAVFIAGSIYDYGTVTGTGSYQTDTKAVFATAENFTVRFGSNPPDPLRATDLDLFDLSATTATGGNLVMTNGASTTAGQVILDNFADLATLSPGTYSNTRIQGATIDATGDRGDGFDLMIMTGDIVGGAPVGGVSVDKTIVTIAPGPAGTPAGGLPTTITSAGGLYVVADEVLVNNQAGTYATFNVAGPSDLIGHVAVDLTDIGALDTNVAGGSVVIDQNGAPLTLGNVTATTAVTINAGDGADIASISATGALSLNVRYGLVAGDITAYSVAIGSYGPATIGNITATGTSVGIEESGGGSITTGNIHAAEGVYLQMYGDGGASLTTGTITAGNDVTIKSYQGDVTVGAVSATNNATIYATGNVNLGGLNAKFASVTAGYTGYAGYLPNTDLVISGAVNVVSGTFTAGDIQVLASVTGTATGIINQVPTGRLSFYAKDMDIEAPITVTDTGGGRGVIAIFSENPLGLEIGDNLTNPTGFQLSNAEFSFLQADTVELLGLESNQVPGIRVGDLTIDASKTATVVIGSDYTSAASTVSIEGTVQGIGKPSFLVGANGAYAGNIIVSGALGTAADPLGYVYLNAASKVVLGSQAYLQEFYNDTNPGVFQPGLGGVANDHEWITADNVVLKTNTGGTIIEQNTSPTGDGMFITGSLTIEGQPYEVNLFGVLPDGNGGELYGQKAATSPDLSANPGPVSPAWMFNGCHFGGAACQPLSNNPYGLPYGGVITGTSGGNVTLTYNGPTLTVDSNAHRVIIDWTSFSIAAGDTVTFIEPDKNAIVVNRQMNGGESDIYGAIMSLVNGSVGGNVWIINPNGVLFGSSAQVNVGGFLASTSNLVSDSAFLTAGDNDPISFAAVGTNYSVLQLDRGANITVHDGTAAFIGDAIRDDGNVYGVGQFQTDTKAAFATAQDFTIRFASNPADPLRATDLDLVDLSATLGGGNLSLSYGSTTAGQIILDRFPTLPFSNAFTSVGSASLDATGDRGDGFDLMILSGDIASGAPTSSATAFDFLFIGNANGTPETSLTSAGGLYVSGGTVDIGQFGGPTVAFNIAGPTLIRASGLADLVNTGTLDPTVIGGSVDIEETQGALIVGNITATGVIDIDASSSVQIGNIAGAFLLIDPAGEVHVGNVDISGPMQIDSSGNVTAGNIDATYVTIHAGSGAGYSIAVGNITGLDAVRLRAGGDIVTGNIDPASVFIESYSGSITTGAVSATDYVTFRAHDNIDAGAVTSGGTVNMSAYNGTLTVGVVTAAQSADLYSHGTLTLGGLDTPDAVVQAGSFYPYRTAPADIVITGPVNVEAAEFIATGTFRDLAPITATATGGYVINGPYFAAPGSILIHSSAVDIEAPITVVDAGGTGRIIFQADNPQGVDLGDNLSNPSGWQMSNAEFQELSADKVYVFDHSRYTEFRVGDLTIDAAKTPSVVLGAGHYGEEGYYAPQSQTISIEGTVEGIGKPDLRIGGQLGGIFGYKYAYTANRVIVSGALGTAANPLGKVEIDALSSIVVGSQTFAGEVANGTAPSGWVEGLGGVQDGHEFISAGDVVLSSGGVIVGQDTSPLGDGMHVTGSLTIEGDPTEVSLFGQLPSGHGTILYGTAAAGSPDLIVISYGGTTAGYRFNGCLFGGGDCEPMTDVTVTSFVPPLYAPTAGVYAGASPVTVVTNGVNAGPAAAGDPTFGPIIVAPSAEPLGGDRDDQDDQHKGKHKKKSGASTVSGMGNEDNWPEGKH